MCQADLQWWLRTPLWHSVVALVHWLLGECSQDFVAPASCHIALWAARLLSPFVAPPLSHMPVEVVSTSLHAWDRKTWSDIFFCQTAALIAYSKRHATRRIRLKVKWNPAKTHMLSRVLTWGEMRPVSSGLSTLIRRAPRMSLVSNGFWTSYALTIVRRFSRLAYWNSFFGTRMMRCVSIVIR